MIINKRKSKLLCKEFKCNGETITDDVKISNKFNNFFVNVGSSLASGIPPSTKNATDFIKHDSVSKFYLTSVTEDEISKIIVNLKNCSPGWDEIKPNIVKHINHCIKMPLAYICNLSFQKGIFPSEMKLANVVPIYKSGDEMLFSNYRPVSVLPVFSKVLERLMYNRLL